MKNLFRILLGLILSVTIYAQDLPPLATENILEGDHCIAVQTNEGNQDSSIVNLDDLFANLALTCFQYLTPTSEPVTAQRVSAFPNPANEWFLVQFPLEVDGSLTILRTDGAVVFTKSLSNAFSSEIPVGNLPPGIYFWKWKPAAEGTGFSGRIVVVH